MCGYFSMKIGFHIEKTWQKYVLKDEYNRMNIFCVIRLQTSSTKNHTNFILHCPINHKIIIQFLALLSDYLKAAIDDMVPVPAERERLHLQLDGAAPHYAKKVREWLDAQFAGRWIGRGGPIGWPARSPDLTPCDFFLWGYVKSRVYAVPVTTMEQLKDRIKDAFAHIPTEMLMSAILAFRKRLMDCIEKRGKCVE